MPSSSSLRSRQRFAYGVFTLVLVAVLPRLSSAQSATELDRARALAGQGFEALKRKDYAAAEELFRRADEFVHAPTLVLDHARALVGLGKLVEGHERYEQVIREGVAENAPWQWKNAVVEARTELAAVDRRMAWLTVTVHGSQAATVEIDGKIVPGAAQGVRRATNPGERLVSARADGFLPAQRSITLEEGQSAALDLKLEPDPDVRPAPAASDEPRPVVVVAPPSPPPKPDHTVPIILMSAGGAALVAGAITGIMAIGVHSDLEQACSGAVCVPSNESEYADYRQQRDKYRTLGTASGVSLAMGAGLTLTGGALLLFTGKQSPSEKRATEARVARASLRVGPGSVFVGGVF